MYIQKPFPVPFHYTYNNALGRRRNKLYFNASLDSREISPALQRDAKRLPGERNFRYTFCTICKSRFRYSLYPALEQINGIGQTVYSLALGSLIIIPPFCHLPSNISLGGPVPSVVSGYEAWGPVPIGHLQKTNGSSRSLAVIINYLQIPNYVSRYTGQISTALFVDAGNIWTKDTLLFGPAGQLSKSWFSEVAVAGGFGIRFDATVLIIRADIGIPFRKPYDQQPVNGFSTR